MSSATLPRPATVGRPAALGVLHAAIDAASGIVLFRLVPWLDEAHLIPAFVLYNVCAFALQPLAGLAVDRWGHPRAMAAAGLVSGATALLLPPPLGWVAIVLVGLASTLFHVGAGVLASAVTPYRAGALGLFIAPGALGLVAGKVCGGLPWVDGAAWTLSAGLLVAVPAVTLGTRTWASQLDASSVAAVPRQRAGLAVWLLLLAVGARAVVGMELVGPFEGRRTALLWLGGAALLGKAGGGWIADALGWRRVAVVALGASVLVELVAGEQVAGAAAALLLFQAVTGVTLAGLYRAMPGRVGTSFGLACLALFVGSLPAVLHLQLGWLSSRWVVFGLGVGAAAAIWWALGLLPGAPGGRADESGPAG